jgi:hypothetical protein
MSSQGGTVKIEPEDMILPYQAETVWVHNENASSDPDIPNWCAKVCVSQDG